MYKEIKEKLIETDADSLGEAVYEAFMEDDNNFREIGKSVSNLYSNCQSEEEFNAADRMLIAITGYGIESLISKSQ